MKRYLLVLLALLLPFSNVLAEAGKGDSYVTIMGSYYDDDVDRNVEDGFRGIQLGYGYALHDSWNIEAVLGRIDADALWPEVLQVTMHGGLHRIATLANRVRTPWWGETMSEKSNSR